MEACNENDFNDISDEEIYHDNSFIMPIFRLQYDDGTSLMRRTFYDNGLASTRLDE